MLSVEEFVRVGSACLRGPITVVASESELTDAETMSVPEWWLRLIHMEPAAAVEATTMQWRQVSVAILPRFLEILGEHGTGVRLVRTESEAYVGLGLAYGGDVPGRGPDFVFGYPPAVSLGSPAASLSSATVQFFSALHDGFQYSLSGARPGIKRSGELIDWRSWLGEEAEDLEFISTPPQPLPASEKLYVLYDENNGAYVVEDADPKDKAVWTTQTGVFCDVSDQYPTTWDVIDSWIHLRMSPSETQR
ncbi:hypothetical protein QN239_24155 [Mycolicibacterium sp. Y3]